jgi:hypothetical protein
LVLFPGIPVAIGIIALLIFGAVQLIFALDWSPGYFILYGLAIVAAPGGIAIIFIGVKMFNDLRHGIE